MTSLHNLHDWSVCSSSIANMPEKIEWVYYNSVHTIPGLVIFYPLHQQVILWPFFLEEAVMAVSWMRIIELRVQFYVFGFKSPLIFI